MAYYEVEMEVTVRKYDVDMDGLCNLLKNHKNGLTNKVIAERLDIPTTMVEHWFRHDRYQSVPDPELWFDIKDLLGIETDEFDESIMTFTSKGGVYDIGNRIHYDISPTLTQDCGNFYYLANDIFLP